VEVVKGSLEGMVKRLMFRSLHVLIIHKVTDWKGLRKAGGTAVIPGRVKCEVVEYIEF
jgi:hypothetical protein